MRKFIEPTARNLLRKPLVLGVPFFGLIALSFASLTIFVVAGGRSVGNATALAVGLIGYGVLRTFTRIAYLGWEESLLFALERRVRPKASDGRLEFREATWTVSPPDTLSEQDHLVLKDEYLERITSLTPGESFVDALGVSERGGKPWTIETQGSFDLGPKKRLENLTSHFVTDRDYFYSLHTLPVVTDPLWLFGIIARLPKTAKVFVRIQGVDRHEIKNRVEHSRRSSAQGSGQIGDVDSEITFDEASLVLQGLSRGDETVVEAALVIASAESLDLDPALFCRERDPRLAVFSILGMRKRFHRSHFVRAVTATDLIPTVFDPEEEGLAILKTLRGYPLYFSPEDSRLEALHWVVSGASGSGKSFFTGLVLSRMLEEGCPMSVLFVDHNRSFRRLVKSKGSPYPEPVTLRELGQASVDLCETWNTPGTLSGIELSDLDLSDKKAAIQSLLTRVEGFLRLRDTTHPFYLVLDECWQFMRDEPVMVQRAFREFRKLNGAVIAITQSLSDFLTDESGQSIFQNAPIRILLRQGEDVSRYQGILGLNAVEMARVSRLKQSKGVFSECLIKTPFLSRFGRLYPTEAEHSILRTDNLREELIAEAKEKGVRQCAFPVQ